MSWQHPHEGDDLAVPEVVYDPQRSARAYDGYADPAAAHGWNEAVTPDPRAYPDAYDTARLDPVPADPDPDPAPGPGDGAVFVDGSGRRLRLMRWGGLALGAACVVFLGAVVTGLFGSSPSGGSLPGKDERSGHEQPRAEHSAAPSADPGARTADPGASPAAAERDEPADSSGGSASPTASAPRTTTAATPTATAAGRTAPARGNSADKPGRGNGTPGSGATKGAN
ncbi:hypothetical protein GTY65_12150 [Streptomyces sp. SID8379]|uniref:hypothetical protein n=1 Tax=unclassified Streptomyces TaxID=2593676 RepID=UPI00036877A3|nr:MULTISPECIES: hypothetical protein [unclassified Streptomyces]MYW64811.1 hypothetical protein [Streptomyces sp. SID8379]